MKKVTGIILVAGNSTRYGKGINKNFENIGNKKVLSYSLRAFADNSNISDIILVVREEDLDTINEILEDERVDKPIKLVYGGSSRKESVYNGLISTNSNIVIIHDGARPVIKQRYIDECIKYMKKYKGVIVGVKSKDTIKIVNSEDEIVSSTDRGYTWIGHTPQCFDRKLLLKLHEQNKDKNITDDSMLLELAKYKVKIIEGEYSNIKITTSDDLDVAKVYLK